MVNKKSYFSHDSNARNSDKLINVRMELGVEGYGIYFMILERLREEEDYKSKKDYKMIAFDLRVEVEKVRKIIEDFGLFEVEEDYFYSLGFFKRMEIKDKRKNNAKESAQNRWKSNDEQNKDSRSQRLSKAREKGTHTKEEWEELKDFFNECVLCGSKENIIKDHIIPIYQGGSDSITNIQPLCRSCNLKKGPDNNDYRINFCENNNLEMPTKWIKNDYKMAANDCKEKESKEKESKVKENKNKKNIKKSETNTTASSNALEPVRREGSFALKNLVIDKYGDTNSDLLETFKDFSLMRKSIKKPLTERALKLIFNKLDTLCSNDTNMVIAVLEQSIEHSWQTVYELKGGSNGLHTKVTGNTESEKKWGNLYDNDREL